MNTEVSRLKAQLKEMLAKSMTPKGTHNQPLPLRELAQAHKTDAVSVLKSKMQEIK
jgi:hypothetical protein